MNQEQLAMLAYMLRQREQQQNGQVTQGQWGLLSPQSFQLAGDPKSKYSGTATSGTRG